MIIHVHMLRKDMEVELHCISDDHAVRRRGRVTNVLEDRVELDGYYRYRKDRIIKAVQINARGKHPRRRDGSIMP